ncbi:hypothetical protein AA101099_2081 [Neoasaia chiangmaiensis NBRC 101099]|uniref:hypothetical protein n=1 Tax=Neoasaia chiangmaiensis TaxID=320497 RepID=UPI00098A1C9C|nr:hypothetical protein [Neoasaia chiangmaiensis]GBR40371.1 hypothetical protein AA101099_2081 [Neoasaia chiangmaiensis NBRC 101099]GEN13931.1 hypothetical protein NCH01_03620 [Neoasaia chiangmaiensis]
MMQFEKLTGPQRVAILMLALSKDDCVDIFDELEEKEIRSISTAMSNLGPIPSYIVEAVCNAFNKPDIRDYDLLGDVSNTERILRRILPEPKAEKIIDEIRSSISTTIWGKLDVISEDVL